MGMLLGVTGVFNNGLLIANLQGWLTASQTWRNRSRRAAMSSAAR